MGEDDCRRCGGMGRVWGNELPGDEDPPTDQRYTCPYCDDDDKRQARMARDLAVPLEHVAVLGED